MVFTNVFDVVNLNYCILCSESAIKLRKEVEIQPQQGKSQVFIASLLSRFSACELFSKFKACFVKQHVTLGKY